MLFYTGLRVSELAGLIIDDVYFGAEVKGFISVSAANSKTGCARDPQLCEKIRIVLKEYRNHLLKIYETDKLNPGDYLFPGSGSGIKSIDPRQIQRIIAEAGKRAGIPGLHPHIFRHTCLTLLSKVMPLPAVQVFAGHKSLQSTQVYMHPSSEDINKGVNQL